MGNNPATEPRADAFPVGTGLTGLVEALKTESGLADQAPEEVARRFSLDVGLVQGLLEELAERDSRSLNSRRALRGARQSIRNAQDFARKSWLSATEAPYAFIVVVFAVVGLTQAGIDRLPIGKSAEGLDNFVFIAGLVAIMGCIARWGRLWVPAFAAAVTFSISFGLALVAPRREGPAGQIITAGVVTSLALSLIVLLVGIVAAFMGHVVREYKLNRQEQRLTRQELLNRAFELQAKFEKERQTLLRGSRMDQMAEAFREHGQYPTVALVLALALGCLRVAVISSLGENVVRLLPFGWHFIFGLIYTMFALTIGYWAPNPRAAMSAMMLSVVGFTLPTGLDRRGFGLRVLVDEVSSPRFWIIAGLVFASSVVIGAVLRANRSEMRRRRLNAGDPSTLAAEIVRTHWRLYGRQRSLVVSVVDVAGSTPMKAGADPARVEYSFRAYQELIAQVTAEHGGKVISTAGDGAVCVFGDAASALEAARDLQTHMPEFNRVSNRLEAPFRIRVGLHAGESGVDLEAAPFNALIDVAAHVEHVAPVGGIALTHSVASRIPREGLAELAARVDDHHVFVVLNPTKSPS